MDMLTVALVIVAVGVGLYLVNRFVPMQATVKGILNGVVILALVIWLCNVFGLFAMLRHVPVPRVK